jgi:hypothetical protein
MATVQPVRSARAWTSRLNLLLTTSELAAQMNTHNTTDSTISWVTLDQLLGSSAQAKEVKAVIKRIKEEVTDHLPVLTRFGRGVHKPR